MKVFVSYCRKDNPPERLILLESQLNMLGDIYIDDLHYPPTGNRRSSVMNALMNSDVFIAVLSRNYARTPWTVYEVRQAILRRIPLLTLSEAGLICSTWDAELPSYLIE